MKKINIDHWNLEKITKIFLSFAIIVGLVGSYLWYNRMYMTDERRFWGAINRSMTGSNVLRTLDTGGSGNKQITQSRLNFTPESYIESKSTVTERSAVANSEVITEGYTDLDEQLVKYLKIDTSEKNAGGQGFDFSNVVNKWATDKIGTDSPEALEQRRINYIKEFIYLAPFGNFDGQFRKEVIDRLKNKSVYNVDYQNVTKANRDGVDYIDFVVRVNTKEYVAILQDVLKKLGLGEFEALNPDNYEPQSRINAIFAVNADNGEIGGISYNGRQEVYSDQGVNKDYQVPKSDITIDELQTLLQNVQ